MFAPSAELVQQYSDVIISAADPQDRRIQELIRDYILRNLAPDPKTKRPRRVMMLLFRGEEAVRKVRSVVGNISADRRGGETIRDTYGDLILDEHDQVRYFEPAVLAAPTPDEAAHQTQALGQLFRQRRRRCRRHARLCAGRNAAAHPGADQAGQFPFRHRPARATSSISSPAPAFTSSASKSIA